MAGTESSMEGGQGRPVQELRVQLRPKGREGVTHTKMVKEHSREEIANADSVVGGAWVVSEQKENQCAWGTLGEK